MNLVMQFLWWLKLRWYASCRIMPLGTVFRGTESCSEKFLTHYILRFAMSLVRGTVKCCSQRFLKTPKDHKDLLLYCRSMAEQSLLFGTCASAVILKGCCSSCLAGQLCLYFSWCRTKQISKAVNSTHLPDISSSSSYWFWDTHEWVLKEERELYGS